MVVAAAAGSAGVAGLGVFGWALHGPTGRAVLRLPAREPCTPVAAALALAPALGALEALEGWLGRGLERIEPLGFDAGPAEAGVAGPRAPAAQAAEPTEPEPLTLDLAAVPGARLQLPVSLLPWGRAAPPGLVAAWPRLRAAARLQAFTAEQLDPSDLHEGALLLLPDAHLPGGLMLRLQRPGWPVLCARPWPAVAGPATLQPDTAAPAPTSPCWLQLREPPPLPASAWFGEPAVLPGPTGGAVLHGPAGPLAEGELLPLGTGWALRVARVLQPATA